MNIKLSDAQDQEFIPILTEEDEQAMQEKDIPEVLPLLSLRNTVLFPGVVIPISVGRDRSVRLIKESNKAEAMIGVVSQKEDDTEVPTSLTLLRHAIEYLHHTHGNFLFE